MSGRSKSIYSHANRLRVEDRGGSFGQKKRFGLPSKKLILGASLDA
jgi:hypothetical protein